MSALLSADACFRHKAFIGVSPKQTFINVAMPLFYSAPMDDFV